MKRKIAITLSPEVLCAVDELAGESSSRSHVIEAALVEFIDRRRRQRREARDLAILDAVADELNREVEELLEFSPG